jgi:hypothetical protein
MGKSKSTINADFEILFHPDLDFDIKEVKMMFSVDNGKSWDDYIANKLAVKKYQATMYDLPSNEFMDFYVDILLTDGRVMKAVKDNQNYRVQLIDKGEGSYKAQVRIKDILPSHRICLVCDNHIAANSIQCETKECEATYCPLCNRMLPPHSNYCPWDLKLIK